MLLIAIVLIIWIASKFTDDKVDIIVELTN